MLWWNYISFTFLWCNLSFRKVHFVHHFRETLTGFSTQQSCHVECSDMVNKMDFLKIINLYNVVQKPFWTHSFKADFTKSSWEFLAISNFKQCHSLKSMRFFLGIQYTFKCSHSKMNHYNVCCEIHNFIFVNNLSYWYWTADFVIWFGIPTY